MICPTAEAILSSHIVQEVRLPTPFGRAATGIDVPTDAPLPAQVARVPTAEVVGPSVSPAGWLQIVERRISNSLQPAGRDYENQGQWLSAETASAATAFFQLTSDVLPGEPHIYSSLVGDLVAEFKAPHGVLNAVISTKAFTALAIIDGSPEETRIEWNAVSSRSVRSTLRSLTAKLCDGEHGSAVAT
jgi:hypothetical protein